jgi:putative SOS response-associated peptidase YedK
MCGRYSLRSPRKRLAEHFGLKEEPEISPRYNIAPTQLVPIIRRAPESNDRQLGMVRWGLIPFWAKEAKIGNRLINARAESVAQKPAFRTAWKQRRCLVPADAFYEWKRLEKGKQPYMVVLRDQGLFAFAGLWERWEAPDGEHIESCTIITTDANALVRQIHDRMPVILKPDDYSVWLAPSTKPERLQSLLTPIEDDALLAVPVSSRVNSPKNEDPSVIEQTGEAMVIEGGGYLS